MINRGEMQVLVEIARKYYNMGLKQEEIAKEYNISRSLVSRYLTKARSLGIVEIIVHDPQTQTNRNLEKLLIDHFDLKDVVCIVNDSNNPSIDRVAKNAANYLLKKLKRDSIVAIASGTTIAEVGNAISTFLEYPEVTFVSMVGGFGKLPNNIQSNVVSQLFATKLGAQALGLYAPVLVDSISAKRMMIRQSFIEDTIDIAKKADIALIGVGGVPAESSLAQAYDHNTIFKNDKNSHKIIGDIGYNFIDKNGEKVDCSWNDIVISMELEDIKKIDNVVCVAMGINKVLSIHAAIKGCLIDTLITDEVTAEELLKYIKE